MPSWWWRIGHGERDLGFVAAGQRVVLADADHVISGLSDERHVRTERPGRSRCSAPDRG